MASINRYHKGRGHEQHGEEKEQVGKPKEKKPGPC